MTAPGAAATGRWPAGLGRLFAPRAVALIGVPGDLSRPGARPLHFLRRHGYPGRIYPVNPGHSTIGDLPAYPEHRGIAGASGRGLDRSARRPGRRRARRVRARARSLRRGAWRRLRRTGGRRSGEAGRPGRARAARGRAAPGPEYGRLRERLGPRGAHLLDRRQAGSAACPVRWPCSRSRVGSVAVSSTARPTAASASACSSRRETRRTSPSPTTSSGSSRTGGPARSRA